MSIGKRINHLYRRVDYSVGKKLFGNTVGVKNNLTGSIKKPKVIEYNGVNKELVEELKSNDYLMLDHPYEDSLIETIRSKYNKLIENDNTSYVTGEHGGKVYSRHVKEPWKHLPEIERLITEQIADILRGYYGQEFNIRSIDINRNYHIPKELENIELFSNHWHCDNRSTIFLKIFVPLCDVTDENGPFHAIKKERTKLLMRKGFGTRDDYNLPIDEIEDPKYMAKATGKLGCAYFANPQVCLHKAGNPAPGKYRDMVHIVFGPANTPLPKNWITGFVQGKDYDIK